MEDDLPALKIVRSTRYEYPDQDRPNSFGSTCRDLQQGGFPRPILANQAYLSPD
jgi:hypothetical protein